VNPVLGAEVRSDHDRGRGRQTKLAEE